MSDLDEAKRRVLDAAETWFRAWSPGVSLGDTYDQAQELSVAVRRLVRVRKRLAREAKAKEPPK